MRYKNRVQIFIIMTMFSVYSFAEKDVYPLLVQSAKELAKEKGCTSYELIVADKGQLRTDLVCLKNRGADNSVWLIDRKDFSVRSSFPVYIHFSGVGQNQKVVQVDANTLAIPIAEYISISVPVVSDEEGRSLCVLNVKGVISLAAFIGYWEDFEGVDEEHVRKVHEVLSSIKIIQGCNERSMG